jgi:DNA polymerase III delta prime subunit
MSLFETIVGAATKVILDRLAARFGAQAMRARPQIDVEHALSQHLREVLNWSARLDPVDSADDGDLETDTVPLELSSEPRRFQGTSGLAPTLHEDDLLVGTRHYLLLGNPGSGKTTTLKRLARRLLTTPPQHQGDVYQFPVVLRLRELQRGESIYTALASRLGLPYETVEMRATINGVPVTRWETRILGSPIEAVIPASLSEVGAVVLLDGLDEIWADMRRDTSMEVSRLALNLEGAKVILSSRTGDLTTPLAAFTAVEVSPLSASQVRDIAARWLSQPDEFLEALGTLPYRDVADRPLLLRQLLLLYKRYGFLPEQPAHVYKRVIRLLLEEWDVQRQIIRRSKYAGFDPDRKAEFLAALAYYLTYNLKQKRFDEAQLVQAYSRFCTTFNLPLDDAAEVAREIETHTGIFVESAHEIYEFSHLSIQEYLCADYLVRDGSLRLVRAALALYPAPVAVAIALSSRPADWFARLVLAGPDLRALDVSIESFLSRLIIERPFFEVYEPLGFAVLQLCESVSAVGDIPEALTRFMSLGGVRESIASALRWYALFDNREQNRVVLRLRPRRGLVDVYEFTAPHRAAVPLTVLQGLGRERPDTEVWLTSETGEARTTLQEIDWLSEGPS